MYNTYKTCLNMSRHVSVVCVRLFVLLVDHGLTCLFTITIIGGGASPITYTKLSSFCLFFPFCLLLSPLSPFSPFVSLSCLSPFVSLSLSLSPFVFLCLPLSPFWALTCFCIGRVTGNSPLGSHWQVCGKSLENRHCKVSGKSVGIVIGKSLEGCHWKNVIVKSLGNHGKVTGSHWKVVVGKSLKSHRQAIET